MERARLLQSFFRDCGGSFSLLTDSGRTLACAHLLTEYAASEKHTIHQLSEVERAMADYVSVSRKLHIDSLSSPRGGLGVHEHSLLWRDLERTIELILLP